MARREIREVRWAQGIVCASILLGLLLGCSAAETVPYEQRLAQALGLMQQGAWQQAMESIGELDGRSPMTPALARQ